MLRFGRLKAVPRLYRANRKSARIALYTSLVTTVLLGAAFVGGLRSLDTGSVEMGWDPAQYDTMEDVVLLQDYLRIDTTPQTGSELAGAQYLASLLEREGIPTEVLDMGRRKANLIAVLEGSSDEALVLHNHIDVDPILEPEKWIYPPFSGHIHPPWIYGRGAFDMKSVAIAQLRALVELKRSGIRPRRSVIFLATSGEETGSLEGTAWLLRERADLLGRSWGVLTEGGVVEARTPSDIKYWGTETGQKRYVRLLLCSPSRERLEIFESDLRSTGQPLQNLRLVAPVAEFLRFYASTRDHPGHRRLLSDPESVITDLSSFNQLAGYQTGLFRDEISPFPIEANGHGYVMPLTLALLPDTEVDEAMTRLLPDWMTLGMKVVLLADDGAPPASPIDHEIFETIQQVLEARYGPVPSGPIFQSRSTNDARLFRRYGIPSYGFSPFLVLSTDTIGIGANNESIALPAYLGGVELYIELVRSLVAPT
jgi:acetylornithine deacetylase/succinyl-diaminopimelate desuccinylase-like protein